jgi:hypothetical protein
MYVWLWLLEWYEFSCSIVILLLLLLLLAQSGTLNVMMVLRQKKTQRNNDPQQRPPFEEGNSRSDAHPSLYSQPRCNHIT